MNEKDHESCSHLLSSLGEYVDGVLDAELCAEIERHMKGCVRCRVVVDTLRKTIELYHDACGETHIPDEVKQRLYARLNLEDYKRDQTTE